MRGCMNDGEAVRTTYQEAARIQSCKDDKNAVKGVALRMIRRAQGGQNRRQ